MSFNYPDFDKLLGVVKANDMVGIKSPSNDKDITNIINTAKKEEAVEREDNYEVSIEYEEITIIGRRTPLRIPVIKEADRLRLIHSEEATVKEVKREIEKAPAKTQEAKSDKKEAIAKKSNNILDFDYYLSKYQKPLYYDLKRRYPGIIILQWGNKYFFVLGKITGKILKTKRSIKFRIEADHKVIKDEVKMNIELFNILDRLLKQNLKRAEEDWLDNS